MGKDKFTEDDKTKFIEFLNLVATHAKFELNTHQLIKYYKVLSHMQNNILPKIEKNILEVIRVVDTNNKEVDYRQD